MDHAVVIGLTVPAVAGCMSAIFFGFWYHSRSDRSALRFAAAFMMCAIGFSLNHFVLPKESLENAIIHNACYAAGLYLLVAGMHYAFQRETPRGALIALGSGSVLIAAFITLTMDGLSQRILWLNLIHGSMLLVGCASLWGIWRNNWTGTAVFASMALCILNFMLVSPLNVIGQSITEQSFFSTAYWQTMNVLSTFSVLAMGGALIATCVMQRLKLVREDADHDYLTGLKTRRAFEEAARDYCTTRSGDVAASLIIIDIDHFKTINDEYGHAAGDQVIRRIGSFLKNQTRSSDLTGRIGGEEFCLLLPGTGTRGARQLAARLREGLTQIEFKGLPASYRVTASFGIAELSHRSAFADIYPMADAALYSAKARGRDRIVCAPAPDDAGQPIQRERFLSLPDGSRIPSDRMVS